MILNEVVELSDIHKSEFLLFNMPYRRRRRTRKRRRKRPAVFRKKALRLTRAKALTYRHSIPRRPYKTKILRSLRGLFPERVRTRLRHAWHWHNIDNTKLNTWESGTEAMRAVVIPLNMLHYCQTASSSGAPITDPSFHNGNPAGVPTADQPPVSMSYRCPRQFEYFKSRFNYFRVHNVSFRVVITKPHPLQEVTSTDGGITKTATGTYPRCNSARHRIFFKFYGEHSTGIPYGQSNISTYTIPSSENSEDKLMATPGMKTFLMTPSLHDGQLRAILTGKKNIRKILGLSKKQFYAEPTHSEIQYDVNNIADSENNDDLHWSYGRVHAHPNDTTCPWGAPLDKAYLKIFIVRQGDPQRKGWRTNDITNLYPVDTPSPLNFDFNVQVQYDVTFFNKPHADNDSLDAVTINVPFGNDERMDAMDEKDDDTYNG